VGAPIYRGWEVRGLGCEGVVEEMTSTIHAQELPQRPQSGSQRSKMLQRS